MLYQMAEPQPYLTYLVSLQDPLKPSVQLLFRVLTVSLMATMMDNTADFFN